MTWQPDGSPRQPSSTVWERTARVGVTVLLSLSFLIAIGLAISVALGLAWVVQHLLAALLGVSFVAVATARQWWPR